MPKETVSEDYAGPALEHIRLVCVFVSSVQFDERILSILQILEVSYQLYILSKTGMKVRNAPSLTAPQVGSLAYRASVISTGRVLDWWRIDDSHWLNANPSLVQATPITKTGKVIK